MKLIIYTDGGARGNPGPAGIGVVFKNEQGMVVGQHKKFIGEATNNVAEYKALLLGLQEAVKEGAEELEINMDSELVVRQMNGQYKVKDSGLKVLAAEVLGLLKSFRQVKFKHVRREMNKDADKLVNEAIDNASSE